VFDFEEASAHCDPSDSAKGVNVFLELLAVKRIAALVPRANDLKAKTNADGGYYSVRELGGDGGGGVHRIKGRLGL